MTSISPEIPDGTRCPGCGAANGCAITAGRPAAECWCMAEPRGLPLPKESSDATASCWCSTCLRQRMPFGSAD